MNALKENYEISEDWDGEKNIGLTVDWDYENGKVHLSMPGYVERALKQFQHDQPKRRQDSPYPWNPPKYGQKTQYAEAEDESPQLGKEEKKFIQRVIGHVTAPHTMQWQCEPYTTQRSHPAKPW